MAYVTWTVSDQRAGLHILSFSGNNGMCKHAPPNTGRPGEIGKVHGRSFLFQEKGG
jgi:hypothetical protein